MMSAARGAHALAGILVVLASILSLQLYREAAVDWAVVPVGSATQVQSVGVAGAGAEPSIAPLPTMADFEAIGERPLFHESRRPISVVAATPAPPTALPPPPPPPPFGPLTLVGLIISPEQRVALVRLSSNVVLRAAEGQTIGGWQVQEITTDGVTFRFGATGQFLKLPYKDVQRGTSKRNVN